MSIERLTNAARAAGFAMVLNDDPAQAPVATAAPKPEVRTALVVSTGAPAGTAATAASTIGSWATPWKLWATGAAPRIGA